MPHEQDLARVGLVQQVTGLAFAMLAFAVVAMTFGLYVEVGQRRERGPVAIVPTLPHAWGAAMLVTLGLGVHPGVRLPMWAYPMVGIGAAIALSATMIAAGWFAERTRG